MITLKRGEGDILGSEAGFSHYLLCQYLLYLVPDVFNMSSKYLCWFGNVYIRALNVWTGCDYEPSVFCTAIL